MFIRACTDGPWCMHMQLVVGPFWPVHVLSYCPCVQASMLEHMDTCSVWTGQDGLADSCLWAYTGFVITRYVCTYIFVEYMCTPVCGCACLFLCMWVSNLLDCEAFLHVLIFPDMFLHFCLGTIFLLCRCYQSCFMPTYPLHASV